MATPTSTYCERSTIPVSGCLRRISCAAWIPSSVCVGGMRMSTIATSGSQSSTAASSSSASAASPDHLDALATDERRDALAQQPAVVGDHDAHGSSAVTTVPMPGGLTM